MRFVFFSFQEATSSEAEGSMVRHSHMLKAPRFETARSQPEQRSINESIKVRVAADRLQCDRITSIEILHCSRHAKILRPTRDPRIQAALDCGSKAASDAYFVASV